MSPPRPHTLLTICIASLIGVSMSGCGIPRVNEVYRLGETDASANNDWTIMGSPQRTHATPLRALAMNAQAMQEVHQRKHQEIAAEQLPRDTESASSDPGNLHEHDTNSVAEFTIQSATPENRTVDGEMLARVPHHW